MSVSRSVMLLRRLSRLDRGADGGEADAPRLSIAIGDPPTPARAGIL